MLLGATLGVLASYLLISNLAGSGSGSVRCPSAQADEVVRVAPSALTPLRTSVAHVMPQRIGRLYEEGTVTVASAFSDNEPSPPAFSPTAPRPAGYEMRWWAPNHDDIVADVFQFASAQAAQRFLTRASSTRCRRASSQSPATRPTQGINLAWLNPEGFAQADLFISRGKRVYRVADVPAGHSGAASITRLAHAFRTIDVLACLLPDARCIGTASSLPA